MDELTKKSKGVAYGVQTSYADALRGMRSNGYTGNATADSDVVRRPAPSIGYQCSPYVNGIEPPMHPAADPTIDVGGKPLAD